MEYNKASGNHVAEEKRENHEPCGEKLFFLVHTLEILNTATVHQVIAQNSSDSKLITWKVTPKNFKVAAVDVPHVL